MRLLIPILLLAGLGVGYLVFAGKGEADPGGAGPGAPVAAAPSAPREPLALADGAPTVRRTDPAAEAAAALPEVPAVVPAGPPLSATGHPEPVFVNGATNDPINASAGNDDFYAKKYLSASRATKVGAFDSLRAAAEVEARSNSKDSLALIQEMKLEMDWLQGHFDE